MRRLRRCGVVRAASIICWCGITHCIRPVASRRCAVHMGTFSRASSHCGHNALHWRMALAIATQSWYACVRLVSVPKPAMCSKGEKGWHGGVAKTRWKPDLPPRRRRQPSSSVCQLWWNSKSACSHLCSAMRLQALPTDDSRSSTTTTRAALPSICIASSAVAGPPPRQRMCNPVRRSLLPIDIARGPGGASLARRPATASLSSLLGSAKASSSSSDGRSGSSKRCVGSCRTASAA
mmetsp:Transcript_10253/g.26657  ORF Transcript_10253/g.26657 Transcript_10253/m.26657 type:complete len:236 (+) Transcript_10253:648-1355(+)